VEPLDVEALYWSGREAASRGIPEAWAIVKSPPRDLVYSLDLPGF